MLFRKRNRRQTARTAEPAAPVRLFAKAFAPEHRGQVIKFSAIAGVAVLGVWAVVALLDRPVQRVEITGQFHRVSPPQIEQAVLAYTKTQKRGKQGLVSLDLDGLKASLQEIDWVDRVRIERRWPDGVRVAISEQIPGARWGERGLLNSRGELFLKDARYMPPELPQLTGPEGTEGKVARLYLDTYPRLAGVGLKLARVSLDERGAWELIVTSAQANANQSGGIAIRLGRQDVEERLDRFVTAASPLIAARAREVSYVDMRYSNGFAVGWIDAAASMANKAIAKGSLPDA